MYTITGGVIVYFHDSSSRANANATTMFLESYFWKFLSFEWTCRCKFKHQLIKPGNSKIDNNKTKSKRLCMELIVFYGKSLMIVSLFYSNIKYHFFHFFCFYCFRTPWFDKLLFKYVYMAFFSNLIFLK